MPKFHAIPNLTAQTRAVSVFDQVPLATMAKAQLTDSVLGLVIPFIRKGVKPKVSVIAKIRCKAARKYLLQFDRLVMKKGVLHHIYFSNDVETHQLVLPLKYHNTVLRMLHDDYGHQGLDQTLALVRERFYWSTMNHDPTEYVTNCHWCHVAKGHYTGPHTQQGPLVVNNPLDLLCIDFLKVDPSRDSKENIEVLTDAFTKFSQAFVTNNQKALTVAKVLVEKWFYAYGILAHIHSDKGQSFENAIISQLYSMYNIKQSMTMPYNLCGNSICKRFNCTLLRLLQSLPKEQKSCWPLHVPSLVFAYNAMPHSVTGYQPYELMFGQKAPAVCDAWLGLAQYNDQAFANKYAWLNEQHELLMSVNRQALKHIKQSAKKSQIRTGGKSLQIPIGNLVLLRDHPEGHNKIQDNYKSEPFVIIEHHRDPNVYVIQSLDKKGPKKIVNRQQLFDLKKSQRDPLTSDPSIKRPKFDPKVRKLKDVKPQICHPYGTRSKTKAASTSVQSVIPDTHFEQRGHSGLGQWVRQFFGYVKEASVQQLSSAERWSPDNILSTYLTGDHQSSF